MQTVTAFSDGTLNPAVRGYLHSPANPNGDALVLTHSAGSDCNAPLLVAVSEIFAGRGYTVLRCDLPFRQERRTGPPFPSIAERDPRRFAKRSCCIEEEYRRSNFSRRPFLRRTPGDDALCHRTGSSVRPFAPVVPFASATEARATSYSTLSQFADSGPVRSWNTRSPRQHRRNDTSSAASPS